MQTQQSPHTAAGRPAESQAADGRSARRRCAPGRTGHGRRTEAGMVLVSSLLLLVVVTLMALSIFRSFGVQEKIAGNTREKQRALQAALSAQQYAEQWIINSSNAPIAVSQGLAPSAAISCSTGAPSSGNSAGEICNNSLASLGINVTTNIHWGAGVGFTPPGLNVTTATNTSSSDVYYAQPTFYITDLGPMASANGEVYKVDAYSFGTSPNTVAVVESTFAVTCVVCNPGAI
jgi:type IV pilus assembly protein PilX